MGRVAVAARVEVDRLEELLLLVTTGTAGFNGLMDDELDVVGMTPPGTRGVVLLAPPRVDLQCQ